MNNTTQQDLFQTTFISGGDKASRAEAPKPTMFLERFRFSIRLDQVLVILIGMLLVCVVVFSLGYEKGKQLGDAKLRMEREKTSRLQTEIGKHEAKIATLESTGATETTALAAAQSMTEIGKAVEKKGPVPVTSEKPSSTSVIKPNAKFTIQFVTYKTQAAADKKVQELVGKGVAAFAAKLGNFYLVCIDSFDTQLNARNSLTKLKSQGVVSPDAYVRSIPTSALKV